MSNRPISIVIIDDHPVICHGLKNIFSKQEDFTVVGEANNAEEALAVVTQAKPDVIILDISLGESDGIDLIDILKEASPLTRTIMYTMHFNKDLVAWSFEAGASGYILKSDRTSELIEAVANVFQGNVHISSNIPAAILADLPINRKKLKK